MTKALRKISTGVVYPMNPNLARHDGMEEVTLGEDGKVVEPSKAEKQPAKEVDLSDVGAADSSETETKPRRSRRSKGATNE